MSKTKSRFAMGGSMASHAQRGEDLYETPELLSRGLFRLGEIIPKRVWEPAAGKGAMVKVLRENGCEVVASDLMTYPGAIEGIEQADFFAATSAPPGVGAIVTNPPYKAADAFIRKGLSLGLPVIVLLRLLALEGTRRSDIIDFHLRRVYVGSDRPPALHRDGWDGPKLEKAGAPFAWFFFHPKPRKGPIMMRRFLWEPDGAAG